MLNHRKVFLYLLSLFIFSSLLFSAENIYSQTGPPVYKIVSINTKGNKNYDSKTIVSYTGLQVGQEIGVPSEETRDAVKKLWNLGLFSDIKIYIDKKFGTDAYLVVEVAEYPRIESIEITGNDDMSTKDLESKINLVKGEVITDQKLKDVEYNLGKYYADEGYALATIKTDMLVSASNEARIRVKINEGKSLTVRNINFQGNTIKSGDLKDAMKETSEKVWWKFWEGAKFDKKKFEEDKKSIINLYKEKGYKDATIVDNGLKDELKIDAAKENVNILIKIDEGKKFYINNIKFEGNKLYSDSLLKGKLGLKKGDVYNIKKLQQNIFNNESETDISSTYLDNGYLAFNADIDEKVVGDNKVDLKIKITENNPFKFGLVNFDGNDKTKDKVLRRELYSIPGDFFTKSSVKRSMEQLRALNYFNPEKLNYDISLANDSTVNMKYIVEERSSDQFNASVGYSGSFGITGSLGLTFNNFDIAEPLSGGAGQILNFNWQFGEGGTYRTFSIGFTEPWLYNTPTSLGVNLYDTRQNYSYDIRETGAYVTIGRRLKWPDDFFRVDYQVKYQKTDVINGDNYYQTGVRDQIALKQILTRSSVFDPVFPTSGTKFQLSTELSGGPFLPGNTEYIKNIFTIDAYEALTRDRKLVLYSNFNFSFINSLADDKYLPPTEVFYMGGNGLTYNTISLRGYDDRNVGPKSTSNSPIGGKVAVKYSAELRYALSLDPLPIFILAFADAGNVWGDIKKTDPFDLRRSVGFGTRLLLPAVGLVGFDFGYGFDRLIEDKQDPKWLFHFQFGRGF
ncbi:MAG: outer membrane protein assembly factor BamA [Bacteroidetes bacterium]|nr:outer membrane protein assembly factor BamA [Bacteroidota bacterium]